MAKQPVRTPSKGTRKEEQQRRAEATQKRNARALAAQKQKVRKQRLTGIGIGVGVVAIVALFALILHFINLSNQTAAATPVNPSYPAVDGISCDASEQLVYHIHVHVSLYINGQPVSIPAQVGIASDGSCYYWLHTHDTTGIIHIESPTQHTYTFGNFLDIWNGYFNQLGFPTQLSDSSGWTVYVNGKLYTGDFRNIPLNAHTLITMGYNSPGIKPDTTYNWNGL